MLDAGKPFYLQVNDESTIRVLHPGTITGIEGETCTCEFDGQEKLSPKEDDAVFIYFQDGRTFMQQSARICSITETESKFEITLETTSDPVSAESRECFRVSTVILGLTVAVAGEEGCPLLNVSASGLSVTTTASFKLGDEILVTLSYDGQEYTGNVIVQSARELDTGQVRYGFHSVKDHHHGGSLQRGLGVVSASVQRLLITRMARV